MTDIVSHAEPAASTPPWPGIEFPEIDLAPRDLALDLDLALALDLDLPAPPSPAGTSLDLTSAGDVPASRLTDTALDLKPVRDLPPGPAGATATAPLVKAPGPPRGRPHVVRVRPVLPGRAHAMREPGRTAECAGRLADPWRLAAAPRLTTLPTAPLRSAPRLETADLVTGLVMATAVPLCLLQVPYATLIPQTTGGTSAVLYAVSLALPFAAAAPLAALAVRRLRGWLVLLAGLVVIVTGGLAASTIHVGEIRAAAALAGAVAGAATALEKQVRIVRRGDARAVMSRVSPSPDFGVAGSLLAAAALGVAGYLAAGAITMQLGGTQTAASAASPQGALVTALSWLELVGATAALMVVTAGPGLGRARRAARRARAHG